MSELQRFLDAQTATYPQALSEIRNGRKRSHWIWFVFPQLKGLGFSHSAIYYGLGDLQEAQDYLLHPILGKRLIEITEALLSLPSPDPLAIMGHPDDIKL